MRRREPIDFRGVGGSIRRAGPKPGAGRMQTMESSAHPGDPNFDQAYAQSLLGNLAESVRKFLSEKYDCRPPGLKTIVNPDGSMKVVGDCPEAAIGIEVTMGVLGQTGQSSPADMGTQDANQDMMGSDPLGASGVGSDMAGGMDPGSLSGGPPMDPMAAAPSPEISTAPPGGSFGIGPA